MPSKPSCRQATLLHKRRDPQSARVIWPIATDLAIDLGGLVDQRMCTLGAKFDPYFGRARLGPTHEIVQILPNVGLDSVDLCCLKAVPVVRDVVSVHK